MNITTRLLVKLSVCLCGFTLLDEDIPIGSEYRIDLNMKGTFRWRCGGCKAVRELPGIGANSVRHPFRFRLLPRQIFGLPDE